MIVVKLKLNILFVFVLGLVSYSAKSMTFSVTSSSIAGPGSFTEAVNLANANIGTDTIEFIGGLQINAAGAQPIGSFTDNYVVNVTESLIINGNGASIIGSQLWVNYQGVVQDITDCPGGDPLITIIATMPGFISVGEFGQDNSGVNVSINDLSIKQFNQVARVYTNASLTLNNFSATEIWGTYQCSGDNMIGVDSGASLTLKKCSFFKSQNWAVQGAGAAILSSANAGDLLVEESVFRYLNYSDQFCINWNNAPGTSANIVSSRFIESGGLVFFGDPTSINFVNSIWCNKDFDVPEYSDRIINGSSGPLNLIASTLIWNSNDCDNFCQTLNYAGLIVRNGTGAVNLFQSAVGFNWDPSLPATLPTLFDNGTSGFSADQYSFIHPTVNQDSATLVTITNQPNLIVDLPAFPTSTIATALNDQDIQLGTPVFPSSLIDTVPLTVPLVHPVTGSPITTDVLGNPRWDANGYRDIGAIQLSLAPHLTISGVSDGSISVVWTEPLHHNGYAISGYELKYFKVGLNDTTTVMLNSTVFDYTAVNLVNGQEYGFKVKAIYTTAGDGPFSSVVKETPLGVIAQPNLVPTPGYEHVLLNWTQPSLGGRTFDNYKVYWFKESTGDLVLFTTLVDYNVVSYDVTGLINDTTYNFVVIVHTTDGASEQVSVLSTPFTTASLASISAQELNIFPNPSNGNFTIEGVDDVQIEVISVDGKIVPFQIHDNDVSLSQNAHGVFFVKIKSNSGQIVTEKIIVE